jgi:hypothetical protein
MVGARHACALAVAAAVGGIATAAPTAHEVAIHQAITDLAIDYLLAQRPELAACGLPEVRSALREGVAREDDFTYAPAGNFLFHFTPPLVDDVRNRLVVNSRCSSVQWGFTPGRCTADMTFWLPDGSGVSVAADEVNLHRYQLVLDDLRATPGAIKTTGLRGLGHFVHLLQDLTSPAHTLQDAHPHLPVPEFDDPSVFEVSNLTRAAFPLPLPTEPLPEWEGADEAFTELQQFTSANFASEKRLAAGQTPAFDSIDANGYLRRNLAANGRPVPGGWRVARIAPVGNGQGLGRLMIDAPVAADQFEQLAQAAIRYTASLIYFVHDEEAPVCEQQLRIQIVGAGSVSSAGRPAPRQAIACGTGNAGRCDTYVPSGEHEGLISLAEPNWRFVGWSGGGCPTTSSNPLSGTCTLRATGTGPIVVQAIFAPQ